MAALQQLLQRPRPAASRHCLQPPIHHVGHAPALLPGTRPPSAASSSGSHSATWPVRSPGATRSIVASVAARDAELVDEDDDLDVAALERKRGRLEADISPQILDASGRDYPSPSEYQQTLWRSFTVGGVGLHTGEYATVRVRPAFAGEGRYFVRVAEGTNEGRMDLSMWAFDPADEGPVEPEDDEEEEGGGPSNEQKQEMVQLFRQYTLAVNELGYGGTFVEYMQEQGAAAVAERIRVAGLPLIDMFRPEKVKGRSGTDDVVEASISEVAASSPVTTYLGEGERMVVGVEALLSALEACGVDNARIEVEGGREMPVIDGSAGGWAQQVRAQGLRLAVRPQDPDHPVKKRILRPKQVITVTRPEDGAFISLYPQDSVRLTYGIDKSDRAPVIGKQWFSYCLLEDMHYMEELAPARGYVTGIDEAMELREQGYLQGGSEAVLLFAYGDMWYDDDMVRFVDDEQARHHMSDLIGDLSLSAEGGHSGLPLGHIMAYKADHALHAAFVRELLATTGEDDYADVEEVLGSTQELDLHTLLRQPAHSVDAQQASQLVTTTPAGRPGLVPEPPDEGDAGEGEEQAGGEGR